MSDSGFSGLPPGGQSGQAQPSLLSRIHQARIENIEGALRNTARAIRLEAQVEHRNIDGTVRLKTEKGHIDVRLRESEAQQLKQGQKIEVEVAAGRPPRHLTVKAVQPPPIQSVSSSATRGSGNVPPPALQASTGNQIQQDTQTLNNVQAGQRPLQAGQSVRLVSYTSAAPLSAQAGQQSTSLSPVGGLQSLPPVSLSGLAQDAQIILPLSALKLGEGVIKIPDFPSLNAGLVPLGEVSHLPLGFEAGLSAKGDKPAPPVLRGAVIPASPQLAKALPQNLITSEPVGTDKALAGRVSAVSLDARIVTIQPPDVEILPVKGIQGKPVGVPKSVVPSLSQVSEKSDLLTLDKPQLISGRVTGFTSEKLPVLSVKMAGEVVPRSFVVQFPASNVQVGSQITMTPLQQTVSVQVQISSVEPFVPVSFFSQFDWSAMTEAVKMLEQAVAAQAVPSLTQAMPNPTQPARLPAAVLFFVAAVRSGDIKNWTGERALDTLRSLGKGNLLERLTRDMGGLQRTSTEGTAQDWRAMALPMFHDGEVQKVHLYTRKDKEGDDDKEQSQKGTRFIFDLTVPRMGNLQLDGYIRHKKLDMILRTERMLGTGMQQAIRRVYTQALEKANLVGEMSFQGKAEQFIKIDLPQETTVFSA